MFKKIAQKLGFDRAILYTVLARIFQGLGGVVSVLLVATHLTGVEQGFYYTFASILAIQVFFELGLGSIITQFVAHENAHLTQNIHGILEGPQTHLSRLSSLLHFCLKWYSILAILIFVVITIIGFVFFEYFYDSTEPVAWQTPWTLMVFGTSLNFLLAPISSFLEGLGKIKEIAKVRLLQQLLVQTCVWTGLIVGLKLYVVAIPPILVAVIISIYFWETFRKLLLNIYHQRMEESISYKKEIFPLQWKVAISWISGYFIFQLFNPVLFATEGAAVAGQMGMTLTILTSIMSLSDSWFSTKIPVISNLIALKNYLTLDKLFNTTLKQSLFIAFTALLIFIMGIFVLDTYNISIKDKEISARFLNYTIVAILSSTILMRQLQSGWATYLRCHKQEPLMWVSFVMSISCLLSTLILGKLYGVYGMTIGYAILTLFATIAIYIVFKQKRNQWHY